jgi:hypothetical protein
MDSRQPVSDRAKEVIERALANRELMEGVRESLAAVERGERGTPGKVVQEEARSRRAG